MFFYHGTETKGIRKFELGYSRCDIDFGAGVYLTTNFKQAKDWVRQNGSVYKFDIDQSKFKWIEYKGEDLYYVLYLCRIGIENIAKEAIDSFDSADVIAGKMLKGIKKFKIHAESFNEGNLSYDEFAEQVELFDEMDQVCFKSQRAIDILNNSIVEEIAV